MRVRTDDRALVGEFGTVDEVLAAAARQFADRDAYVDAGRRLSFAEWAAAADALATELDRRGVGRGDVVALMLPSSVDFAICYAAVAKLGGITTGLNTRLGRREVDSIMRQCAPALVVLDDTLGLPDPPQGTPVLPRGALAEICAQPVAEQVTGRCAVDDVVTIMWTSGTTGQPKGACLDHRNLRDIAAAAGVTSAPADRRLVATPFAHAGYMAKLWDQLVNGLTVVVSPPKWSAAEMLRLIVTERITLVGAVPTQWEKLLRLPELDDSDLSRVRLATSATAPARPELVAEVKEKLGCSLIVRYAMTESPSICGTDPDDPPEVQFRTVGRPQHGMEVSVVAGPGEVGLVRIRGGCVMRGYWNAPDLTRQAFDADGWLVSGDLGFLREDGNLVIVGRANDMYIRGGYNVYPAEVEAVLTTHPAVSAASVVGSPAPTIGEIGVAFVVPADAGAPPTIEELRALVRSELADYKAPDRLELLERLPVNSMLKVDKNALRALAKGTPA